MNTATCSIFPVQRINIEFNASSNHHAAQLMNEHSQSLWSPHRPLCSPDPDLLARVRPASTSGGSAGGFGSGAMGSGGRAGGSAAAKADAALRRHFVDLTGAFLTPFMR